MSREKPKQIAKPRLSDLGGIRISLMLPPSPEIQLLSAHLARIGCISVSGWPIPEVIPDDADVIITTVEPEYREAVHALLVGIDDLGPPIIALAEYEDPSTLQLILEMRAVAVIERPIKPFGLLTNLMIARDVWHRRRETVDRVAEAEQRHLALSKVAVAKILLAEETGVTDAEAHKKLQKLAMDSRSSLEKTAEKIIADGAPPGLMSAIKKLAN